MKQIKEKKSTKRIIITCLSIILLPLFLTAVMRLKVSAFGEVTLSAPDKFFGRDKCLTVTVTGNADDKTIGLIAEATTGSGAVERRFATKSGSGDVKFDAFGTGSLYTFRVIAVDKNTLAPVCNARSLTRTAGEDDFEKSESDVSIPVMTDGTSTALKAVTKDLILAKRSLASLEALCTDTVSVEYTEDVLTEETDADGVTIVVSTQQTKTEEMTRYDAIAYNNDALTEATNRLNAMKSAYEKLRAWAVVLYQLAGENEQLKAYALQAGDIAKEAVDATPVIENDFALKQKDKDMEPTGFTTETTKIRDAHEIIRVSGGALLLDGGFCTYPKGADLALVSDEDSSAIILSPDNGKVTEGTATRADFSESMSKIIITSGENAAEFATLAGAEDPCFRYYDGLAVSDNKLTANLTTVEYLDEEADRETAVSMLTAYVKDKKAIASNGTYETYAEIEEAFLAAADDSDETLSALSGGDPEGAAAAFTKDLAGAYNDRRGLTERWSCGDPKYLKSEYYGRHCTTDRDGNIIGKYEAFGYGVKDMELYFASPVPDKNGDLIPDSRKGCVYEKIWRNTDYPDPDDFEAAAHQEGYDPTTIRTHLYEVYEYGGSVSSLGGGFSGFNSGSYAMIEEINEYDDPEGEPSVQVCHFKRYYENNENGQVEIESVAVYNPALWEYYKSQGRDWDKVRSKCYDILKQRNYARNGDLKLDITYVGSVPGYASNDMVYVKEYDLTGDTPMLAYEYYEPALDMSGYGMLMGYAYFTFNPPSYRSAYKAYYTPKTFDENERTRRVPEEKRKLFYGKVRYYNSKDGSITGYNHLVSWADPREEEPIRFNGADIQSFPTDGFLEAGENQKNVGILHWVIRDDDYEITSSHELVYRIDDNT
ncbi:MAG: hypothetical protein K6E16_01200 [Lachnospiraceae bacterium]|nr:hypothetical protein [Lachnospiraceae bacterium]